jgi:Uma2 family endonuclease
MAPATTTTRLTYDDLLELPADGNRYEIINGELFVNPAPILFHQRIVQNIFIALELWARAHRAARVYVSPVDVMFTNESVVEPDIVVIKSEREGILANEKNVQGAPNLCIEVLSPSTRRLDEVHKRKLYERGGVDEYWIVDPELELVKIYRRAGAIFERAAEISTETGGTLTTPLLPEFALGIAEVFAP